MSNVINASGKTLTNSSTTYAPSTSASSRNYTAPSNSAGPGANVASYGINNVANSASQVAFRAPGSGSALGNKSAESDGSMREYNNFLAQYMADIAYQNNLASARETNDYNSRMMREANQFNYKMAIEQMNFQKMMSDTAHQREVKDLIQAGLNPVLSANSGASSPSGASVHSAQASGVSANSPIAQVDMNQYASNSLFSVLTDVIANWLVNNKTKTKSTVGNVANSIKKGAKDVLDKITGNGLSSKMREYSNFNSVINPSFGGGSR